jgi:hypothetical protein
MKKMRIGQTIQVSQVKDPKMLTKCPECGKSVDSNDMFCRFCGIKLRKESKREGGEDLELNVALDPDKVPTTMHPGIVNQPFGTGPASPLANPGIPGGANPLAKLTALANRVASYEGGKHRDCADKIMTIAQRYGRQTQCNPKDRR